ncbi:hypothetical protein T492DRAFT_870208 [Pavlovales sp. CCMP2436]|nr:hypothetical protein T492DRAFT_870208 [Pavlovales sp. CCMP2436]
MSKRARTAEAEASTGGGSQPSESLYALMTQLPRAALEELVHGSIASGVAVSRDALVEQLGRSKDSGVGTINCLTTDLLVNVLRHLPICDRARATRVCVDWHALKEAGAGLFVDLGHSNASQMLQILTWLPVPTRLRTRFISVRAPNASKGTSPHDMKNVLLLTAHLERVTLTGDKINAAVLGMLKPHAATLTHLHLFHVKEASHTPGGLAALAEPVPRISSESD